MYEKYLCGVFFVLKGYLDNVNNGLYGIVAL